MKFPSQRPAALRSCDTWTWASLRAISNGSMRHQRAPGTHGPSSPWPRPALQRPRSPTGASGPDLCFEVPDINLWTPRVQEILQSGSLCEAHLDYLVESDIRAAQSACLDLKKLIKEQGNPRPGSLLLKEVPPTELDIFEAAGGTGALALPLCGGEVPQGQRGAQGCHPGHHQCP